RQSRSFLDSLAIIEKARVELQNRTVDFVASGEQQPETDHNIRISGSNSGNTDDRFWRDARNEGFFSYNMTTGGESGLSLLVTYRGTERGNRKFDIYIGEEKLKSEDNTGRWNQNLFIDVEYPVPDSMTKGKKNITIRFQSQQGSSTSQVYYVRLVRKK
ncbi:MAG: DUF6805 domain-containing protein, partial [Bacteroidales bacterium]